MTKLDQRHDKFFKKWMSHLLVACDFFATHLSNKLLNLIDLSTLALTKESFIDARLSLQYWDILYKVKIRKQKSYIYLLREHQSTGERFMPLRIFQYIFRIIHRHVYKLKCNKLPLVVPIIFYNGQKPYIHHTNIFYCFAL